MENPGDYDYEEYKDFIAVPRRLRLYERCPSRDYFSPIPEDDHIRGTKRKTTDSYSKNSRVKIESSTNPDVIIKLQCSNGDIFESREILRKTSPYFRKLFETDESKTEFTFPKFTNVAMNYVLYYIKTSNLPPYQLYLKDDVTSVISASSIMNLLPLFEFWWCCLRENLSTDNFGFIWNAAINYNRYETICEAVSFMIGNANKLAYLCPDSIRGLHVRQMKEFFIKGRTLIEPETMATVVCIWGDIGNGNRRNQVLKLCNLIAPLSKSYVDFMSDNVVKVSTEVRELLIKDWITVNRK